mgnify:CR=1 FL=1
MSEGIIKKFRNWMTVEGDEEEYYEDEVDYGQRDEIDEEPEVKAENINTQTAKSKIVNIHTNSQMKVVIAEPKKYEDVTVIADHLKQKRTVIVNLEGLAQDVDTRKAIFYFMSGAVYVLDGTIQKVSRAIFILAPSNVDIDANMKKELESKAFFPWQK